MHIWIKKKTCNVHELCAFISPHKYLDILHTFVNVHAVSYIHHDRTVSLDDGTTT